MKHYITPEEHARQQRRRGRQALGLLIAVLVIVGFVTVLRAGVGLVANLFDDTALAGVNQRALEQAAAAVDNLKTQLVPVCSGVHLLCHTKGLAALLDALGVDRCSLGGHPCTMQALSKGCNALAVQLPCTGHNLGKIVFFHGENLRFTLRGHPAIIKVAPVLGAARCKFGRRHRAIFHIQQAGVGYCLS